MVVCHENNNNDLLDDFFPIFPEKLNTDEKKIESDEIERWIETIEAQYHFEIVEYLTPSNSHYPSIAIIEHSYPLHYAAANGDLNGAKNFLYQGFSINSRDHLNSTPLHVAVIMNQSKMVDFLISHGADVNSLAYEAIDPFGLALIKGHYNIAKQLLESTHLKIDENTIYDAVAAFEIAVENEVYNDLNDIAEIIKHLVSLTKMPLLIPMDEQFTESMPLSVAIYLCASYIPDEKIRKMVYNLAEYIDNYDNSGAIFLDAKLLMHVLPVAGTYVIEYGDKPSNQYHSFIHAEGHYGNYTVDAAEKLVGRYLSSLYSKNDLKQSNVFSHIKNILHESVKFSNSNTDPLIINDLFKSCKMGNTILIPTGWRGHFVVTVIDGKNGYMIVSNTGMAYEGNESGSILYKIHHPENLTPTIIADIAQNTSQFYLEYDLSYQLGLEKLYVLPELPQTTGNCGWRSIEVGVEALAFLNLVDQGYSYVQAEKIAHQWHMDWNQFLTTEILRDYLADDPRLEIQALSDILVFNHSSLFDANQPISTYEWERAKLIVDAMGSEKYIEQFPVVAMDYKHARPELIQLMQSHGLELWNKKIDLDNLFDTLSITTEKINHLKKSTPTTFKEKTEILEVKEIVESMHDILMDSYGIQSEFIKDVGIPTFEYSWQKDADVSLVLYDIS